MSTANLEESGFGAVELVVEVDAVTRTGNKANPVLVAGRVMGVSGHKCGGEVGVTAGLLARSLLQDGVVGPRAVRLL